MTRLLLVGAGHAHLGVLADFARQPLTGVEVTLVTPYPRQIYSGMLPGWMAGHYTLEQCAIAVAPVAARAQVRGVLGQVVRLDVSERCAHTAQGERLEFDVVSINTGAGAVPQAGQASLVGAALRPIEDFIHAWSCLLEQCVHQAPQALVVVGGGAAGVESVLAMAWRLSRQSKPPTLWLISGVRGVWPDAPCGARRRVLNQLERARVSVIPADVQVLEGQTLHLSNGQTLHSDWTLWATGTAAAAWPHQAGLAVDERGFIRTQTTLQSISHPFVYAVGDCASMDGHPHARSGVYAVRAGAPLARNLRNAMTGAPLCSHVPSERALYLLSTGGQHAIASWGAWSLEGDWVWHWKDAIDRRFIARHAGESQR